jgi:hypothetical protein
VLAEPENIKTLENLREYDKWNKSIKNKAGVYIGYTIRSWQSNYKTFEQFIIKIEASGKATLTALDDNDEFRFGFIDSAEHNYFSIRFSDKEFTEDGSFRFKMTFVSDPTSLPNERNIGYVGVMSGLEKTMSPSAGKVALIRVSIDTNIDVTKYPFLKKRNSSTSMGLSQVVSSFFDSFRTGILEQFLTTESDKQAFERIYPKNWLTGFFAPYNIYDFNETNVIYRNWFGHNIGIGDLGISQPIHLLLFSASKEFYRRELNNEKLDVYKYPLRVQSDRTVLAFTLSNDTNGLSGESHLIDDHFIFTCFDNKNDDKRFYLQGVIKNWRSLVKAALGDTKNKIYCEGVIIVRSRDSEFLKAARIIAIPDKEKYTDVNNWRDAYKKPIVDDDDTSKQHTKISYNLRNSTETELLDSHFKGLSNYMKGHMNRLIVSEPLEQVNQYELKRRFKENITVYFYSACFAAQRNETELAKKYLWQAWSHGFPSDGQSNQEHMKLIKETVFDEKGVFNNVFFKSLFEKIWVNEYIKWKNIYSK